mgnify:CR=1 FL=1
MGVLTAPFWTGGLVCSGGGGVAVDLVGVGVGVLVVRVGVGVGGRVVGAAVVRVGDAVALVVALGVGVGDLLAFAAQTAPPTRPRSAASTMPPITHPMIERLGSSP